MDKREQKNSILNNIYSQINAFDNKASILITVVSLVSAISLSLISVFSTYNYISKSEIFKVWFPILLITLYIVSFLDIASFVLAIVPRRKLGQAIYANYYKDISHMNFDEYEAYFNIFIENDDLLTNQIIINSVIASKKHFWLKIGVWLLPIYGLIAIAIVAMIAFF